jgi:hypothetical protein
LLIGRGWRPQDCDLLDDYSDHIEAWTLTAVELLGEVSPTVGINLQTRGPLPSTPAN